MRLSLLSVLLALRNVPLTSAGALAGYTKVGDDHKMQRIEKADTYLGGIQLGCASNADAARETCAALCGNTVHCTGFAIQWATMDNQYAGQCQTTKYDCSLVGSPLTVTFRWWHPTGGQRFFACSGHFVNERPMAALNPFAGCWAQYWSTLTSNVFASAENSSTSSTSSSDAQFSKTMLPLPLVDSSTLCKRPMQVALRSKIQVNGRLSDGNGYSVRAGAWVNFCARACSLARGYNPDDPAQFKASACSRVTRCVSCTTTLNNESDVFYTEGISQEVLAQLDRYWPDKILAVSVVCTAGLGERNGIPAMLQFTHEPCSIGPVNILTSSITPEPPSPPPPPLPPGQLSLGYSGYTEKYCQGTTVTCTLAYQNPDQRLPQNVPNVISTVAGGTELSCKQSCDADSTCLTFLFSKEVFHAKVTSTQTVCYLMSCSGCQQGATSGKCDGSSQVCGFVVYTKAVLG